MIFAFKNEKILDDTLSFKPNKPLEYKNPQAKFIKINIKNIEKSAHASSLEIAGNKLLIAYFAGEREGAGDVKIYIKSFSLNNNALNNYLVDDTKAPKLVLSREILMKDSSLYIKKLGNPVLFNDTKRLNLFVVGVSLGGWATSRIYHYTSPLGKIAFKYQGLIKLSNFLNISNLVRTKGILLYKNNKVAGFYLPIYHELANKYSLLLGFDENARLVATRRIKTQAKDLELIQPSMSVIDEKNALIAFRNHKEAKIKLKSFNIDKKTFKNLAISNIMNKNNSLNLLNFDKKIFLIYNKDLLVKGHINHRGSLDIALLSDASKGLFTPLKSLASIKRQVGELSYPSSIAYKDVIFISYTNNREFISLIALNKAYLDSLRYP